MTKYLKYFIGLFLLVVVGSILVRKMIESNTPPFMLDKLEQLKSDKKLMDSIGGFHQFEYSYNKRDFENGDTVKFSIGITGGDHQLNYKGIQVKRSSGNWELVKDTLTITR